MRSRVPREQVSPTLAELVDADPLLRDHPGRLSWAHERWLGGIAHLRPQITKNREVTLAIRAPIVFGALLVPILAAAGASASSSSGWRVGTLIVSIAVALCTAFDQVYRPSARWRLVRGTRSALEAEGWAFLQRAGKYAIGSEGQQFQLFFNSVESLWKEYEGIYMSQVAHTQELRTVLPEGGNQTSSPPGSVGR